MKFPKKYQNYKKSEISEKEHEFLPIFWQLFVDILSNYYSGVHTYELGNKFYYENFFYIDTIGPQT